jgi:hypothetical protein
VNGLPPDVSENLRFLIAEIMARLDDLKQFLKRRTRNRAQRVLDRRGYSENLMLRVQNGCIQAIAEAPDRDIARLRAIQAIAADLERVMQLARDAILQMDRLEKSEVIAGKDHVPMLDMMCEGIDLIEPALDENDTQLALQIGECEHRINLDYHRLLKVYTQAIKQKKQTEDFIIALLVTQTLERMGAILLDISESLLSAILGQSMDIDRYHALMDSLQRLSGQGGNKERKMEMKSIAETRSGSGITGISSTDKKGKKKSSRYLAIYKDGLRSKLKQERQGVESWHEIYPGLAPRILSYKRRGNSASLLIEHLSGITFEQILISESDEMLEQAIKKLGRTQNDVWKETRRNKPVAAEYMKQLNARLADVFAVHPEFEAASIRVCGHRFVSFAQLIKLAARLEQKLEPPFSVYIHGDFNVDNIIYDPVARKINYIDLHRSQYMDYVQDVSVFMVSNYRLQIMDAPVRKRILAVICRFYNTTARFAKRNNDDTYELRLALGLARSFVTSTRFILDKSLAKAMYLRARYLLEQVNQLDEKDFKKYRVPVKALFNG